MRKSLVVTVSAVLVLSSCGTYTGQGAFVGGEFGSILGSAIGGISGGPRGSDVGTIVGMAGGAILGAAVGAAADQADQAKYEQHKREYEQRRAQRSRQYGSGAEYGRNNGSGQYEGGTGYGQDTAASGFDDSGFDPSNSGDDRIDFGGAAPATEAYADAPMVQPRTYSPQALSVDQLSRITPGYSFRYNSMIEIRNVRFGDVDGDGQIKAKEQCQLTFEIMNNSSETIYGVQPTVLEASGNKHIHISPNIRVESILPNKGVRYTSTIYGDSRLKNGEAVIRIAVAQGNREITSQIKELKLVTRRK
jgi:hypothetical protein